MMHASYGRGAGKGETVAGEVEDGEPAADVAEAGGAAAEDAA
jgi:hypothetical protein